MGYKTLELTLISGKDLKNVSMMGKMDVYVVVSISGDPNSKQKTPTHQDGGTSPCWNHTLRFTFDEATATFSGWEVVCVLRHDAFGPDKDLGEVRIPIKDLVSGYNPPSKTDAEFLTYQVKSKSSGKAKGELKISYRLKDAAQPQPPQQRAAYPASSSHAPAYAYPPPPQQAAPAYAYPAAPAYPPGQYGYPPQQPMPAQYGYPQQGGYPVQQGGYGYPAQQAPPRRGGGGSGLGLGLGAGLLGGAVGGLLIGEMMEDSFDGDGDF